MPFGLSKKEKDRDLDAQKSSLFGRSSKPKTANASAAAPASSNPYAAPPSSSNPYAAAAAAAPPANSNPYAPENDPFTKKNLKPANPYVTQQANDPYAPPTQAMGDLKEGGGPPSYRAVSPSPSQRPQEKSPVPPGGYGGGAPRYQSQGSYGQSGGYGGDPYGGASESAQQSRYGAGGYGGLGRTTSNDTMATDAGRSALFGDAPKRAAENPPPNPSSDLPPGAGDNSYSGGTGGYDSTEMPGGYGAQRELTAEEQEEEDVNAAKSEIKFIKQQDVSSTRNARRIAEQAEATGRETLARLGAQGDRIHNTERNLDLASHQNRLAEEKARELKTLNRSMFAVHVDNPFTKNRREQAANAIALDKHQRERAQRDATTANAYSSKARQQGVARDLNGNAIRQNNSKSLADRAKYQFEADSEDDEMENEIDDNLDAIYRGARTLNQLGKAMGDELDSQNKHIDRIITKTDKVDDQIAVNRARLDRISRRG